MSKKNKKAPVQKVIEKKQGFRLTKTWMYLVTSLAILLLYGNTVKYGYALDDGLFVQYHASVNKGIAGIPEIFSQGSLTGNNGRIGQQPYRPVTLTTFAIDKAIAGDNPAFGHFMNVLLYMLVAIVFVQWLTALFPSNPAWANLLITLFFISHPVHIEVVANIKSRDEILAALFGLKAFELLYKTDFSQQWLKKSIVPCILLLIALLSKESAITLLPLFAVALFILKKETIKTSIIASIPFGITIAVYLGLRQLIVGGGTLDSSQENIIHNILFAPLSFSQMWGTKMEFLLEYFRILFWPYPLSWDYSYNQLPVIDLTAAKSVISIVLNLALIATALLLIRKRPVISFAILLYFITTAITNNIFLVIEATVSERFMFLPSAALAIIAVGLVSSFFKKQPERQLRNTAFLIGPVIVIFALIVWQHSPVWSNNQALFEAGVKASPESVRANFAIATVYREQADNATIPDSSIKYYRMAIPYYEKGLSIYKDDAGIFNYLAICYQKTGDTTKGLKAFRDALQSRPDNQYALHEMALFYANRNIPDSSIAYATKFSNSYPKEIDGYLILTGSYFAKSEYSQALVYAQKAYQIDSTNANAIRNMAGVLQALGKAQDAQYYLSRIK